MVLASELEDIYSPFRLQVMIHDEIPSSSEDGSGLHSPVGGVFPRMPQMPPLQGGSESFRYQHEPQADMSPTAEILAPQFDFAQGLNENHQQQIPILDTRLEPPSPGARQVTFSHYNQLHSPRYHLGHFTQYSSVSSRIPTAGYATSPVNLRFIPPQPEQPSSGGPSHEPVYYQQQPVPSSSANMDGDHRSHPVATAERTEPSMSNPPVVSVALAKYDATQLGPNAPIVSEEITSASMMQCPNEGDQISVPRRRPNPPSMSDSQETQPHRVKENSVDSKRPSPSPRHPDRPSDLHIQTVTLPTSPNFHRPSSGSDHIVKEESPMNPRHPTYAYGHEPFPRAPFPRSLDSNTLSNESHPMYSLPASPTFEARQREWWDQISEVYSPTQIIDSIEYLRLNTTHQLTFINLEFLSAQLYDDVERVKIQPAFILAILALAQLLQSSVTNQGVAGMSQAIELRLRAQTAIDVARQSGLIHPDLAKAQFLLAIFESSAYTEYSRTRATAALHALDDAISGLSLTTLDARDPSASVFTHGSVPTIFLEDGPPLAGRTCKCLPYDADHPSKNYETRAYSLPWPHHISGSRSDVHDEEIRRLCWSALSLVSDHNAQCMALGREVPNFALNHPGNFALLFPGETSDRLRHRDPNDPLMPKESVWALYCRSMLLWNYCVSLKQEHTKVDDKIEAFTNSVGEAQIIEDALNVHRCNLDTTIIYLTREYLFNIRLLVAHEVRVCVVGLPTSGRPGMLFNTKHVEEWVRAQQGVIQKVKSIIHNSVSGQNELARQPFVVSWFVNQLNVAVLIWPYEQSMVGLLELAKDLLFIVDILNYYWDCPENSNRTEELRQELIKACHARGVAPPLPTSYIPQNIRPNAAY
ncbi:hypothetical protein NP233_g8177 [Leucocoprinus birnbaumii]|uniref:Transcription factor domain-containing protein n=1 Tax=Leucocoprinus birnbaumii TaxID=56174 RepID=A0AAD5VPE4_9AGAR|nr:hypothetical protein NP233_g8177 [Leucocoprinus birnbaumii]